MEESRLLMPIFSSGNITTLIILIVLVMCSAFFSASETSISSVNKVRIKVLADDGKKSARRLMCLLEKYDKTISTILIGNNLVNIAIATIAVGFVANFIQNPNTVDLVSTLSTTIVVLIFGEIFPKTLAKQHSEGISLFVSTIIYSLSKLFTPLTYLFSLLKKALIKGGDDADSSEIPSDENELGMILDEMQEMGNITEEENDFIHCVLTLNDKSVSDIMVPRVDMVMIHIEDTIEEIKNTFFETKFSRIPVYDEDKDDIIGILYERDFFTHLVMDEKVDVKSILRKTQFVPRTLKVDNLIKELKSTKTHIAIVVDEFGGTSGIVTMEDIIEEIVGEINDEYDEEERSYVKINDHTYVFEAKTLLSDFYKIVKVDSDVFEDVVGDADTLAGLLLEIKGEFPKLHEKLEYDNFLFEVLEMDARRILKIKVIISASKEGTL